MAACITSRSARLSRTNLFRRVRRNKAVMRSHIMNGRKTQTRFRQCSGQALVEFALISLVLITLLFGLIDFGRAILVRQVMVNLSREGANLASRGTSFPDTLN